MLTTQLWGKEEIHLHPGEMYCSEQRLQIKTLLGSCVAVCLWEEKHQLGGMNHVMLPLCREKNVPSTRYANVATYVLYDMMIKLGARKRGITARIFGGASRLGSGFSPGLSVGLRNIDVTQRVLRRLGIPIVGSDTGGNLGRKLCFDQFTGKIRMSYLRNYSFSTEEIQVIKGERRDEVW